MVKGYFLFEKKAGTKKTWSTKTAAVAKRLEEKKKHLRGDIMYEIEWNLHILSKIGAENQKSHNNLA